MWLARSFCAARITQNIFRSKQDAEAVCSKVQVPPVLRQRRNAALGYFVSPHLALGAICV